MFTGIVEEIGTIKKIERGRTSASITVHADKVLSGMKLGDSINTNGVCLSVTSFDHESFTVDAVSETMGRTNLKYLNKGANVNLERALRPNDRMGGHMVNGHIDGTGTISALKNEETGWWLTVKTKPEIMRYIVLKGSVALDGISLTVAGVSTDYFNIAVIPITGQDTTLLSKKTGDILNIECDIVSKYIEKFIHPDSGNQQSGIDYDFLNKYGFTD